MSGRKKGKKRGRPPGPCNARELAQRRGAAWVHGGRAQTAMRRAVHPCRRDLCPFGEDGFPCDLKRAAEDDGRAMENCLVTLAVDRGTQEAYRKALLDQDAEGIKGLVADSLAASHELNHRGLGQLLTDGLTVDEDVIGRGEDGESVVVSTRQVVHPAAGVTLKLSEMVGATAAQQTLTPKSRGEKATADAALSLVGFMAGKRRALDRGVDE